MRELAGGKIRYDVFGPLVFRRDPSLSFKEAISRLFSTAPDGLSKAVGAYVWTIEQGGKRVPWNIGLTSKQGFQKRFEQKAASFVPLLAEREFGIAEVYLVALRNKKNGFRKPTKSDQGIPANDWLETMLISSAIRVNPKLKNTSKSKYMRNAIIAGYLNDEVSKRTSDAHSFNQVFETSIGKRK